MFSRIATLLALRLLVATPAFGADALTASKSELQRLRAEVTTLRDRQHTLRTELNGVGDRIEALKAKGSALLRRDALDAELKRSQELSGELTGIAAQISHAEETVTRAQQAVVEALTAELGALRSRLESTQDRDARRNLIARMRALREERDQFSAALPRGAGVPSLSNTSSDDPEDLLEQADALRDNRDKIQKRLAAIQKRAGELRHEQELERRLNEFVESESLFDENDRRLGRTSRGGAEVLVGVPAADSAGGPFTAGGTKAPGSPAPQRFRDPTSDLGAVPADDLRALEAEEKRLSTLANELEARARDAEKKALELR